MPYFAPQAAGPMTSCAARLAEITPTTHPGMARPARKKIGARIHPKQETNAQHKCEVNEHDNPVHQSQVHRGGLDEVHLAKKRYGCAFNLSVNSRACAQSSPHPTLVDMSHKDLPHVANTVQYNCR